MNNAKVNRHFESWLSQRMNIENGKLYRIANGVIFLMGVCLIGFILLVVGFLKIFGALDEGQ